LSTRPDLVYVQASVVQEIGDAGRGVLHDEVDPHSLDGAVVHVHPGVDGRVEHRGRVVAARRRLAVVVHDYNINSIATCTGVDLNSNPWVANAQIKRRDTKFRNLVIRLGYQIFTFGLTKMYINLAV
jgi:hypothetical protein